MRPLHAAVFHPDGSDSSEGHNRPGATAVGQFLCLVIQITVDHIKVPRMVIHAGPLFTREGSLQVELVADVLLVQLFETAHLIRDFELEVGHRVQFLPHDRLADFREHAGGGRPVLGQ